MADIETRGRPDVSTMIGSRVRVPKTSEIVADQLRGMIIRGELQEGASLPPEGQLMATLGISRPTLREAFRILEAENLISVVRGSRSGATVHRPSVELVSRYAGYVLQSIGTSIGDLYDGRLAIEPHVVRRLATNPDPEVVRQLRSRVVALQQLIDEERFTEFYPAMADFHHAMVELTGNKTLVFLTRMLHDLMTAHQIDFARRKAPPHDARRKSLILGVQSYTKLIDLIEAGEVDAAIAHWRLHLQNANQTWIAGDEGQRTIDSLVG